MKHLLIIISCILILFSCKKDCKDTNCLNGGTCVDNRCNCPPGFSGERCEIIDSCKMRNCQNNSTCKNGKCECLPTFFGISCEENAVDGKKYVVKNLQPAQGHEHVLTYDAKEVVNGDEFLASVSTDTSLKPAAVKVIFSGIGHFRAFYGTTSKPDELFCSINKIASHNYMLKFEGTVHNNWDSVHVQAFYLDNISMEYKDYVYVGDFDLIRQ